MSQNLLVQRLKFAKRELTALKTAHKRGLGLLKVYTKTYTIPPPSGSASFYWLTIELEFEISNYPFLQEYLVYNDIATSPISTTPEFEYKNDGEKAEFRMVFEKRTTDYSIRFNSTSPIVSMNYSWSVYT